MSLMTALDELANDRDTRFAVRRVLEYLEAHRSQHVDPGRVASVTGIPTSLVRRVFAALEHGSVVDCALGCDDYTYAPGVVAHSEVERYIASTGRTQERMQSNVERFRGAYLRRHLPVLLKQNKPFQRPCVLRVVGIVFRQDYV
jgi:hypothetical protein